MPPRIRETLQGEHWGSTGCGIEAPVSYLPIESEPLSGNVEGRGATRQLPCVTEYQRPQWKLDTSV